MLREKYYVRVNFEKVRRSRRAATIRLFPKDAIRRPLCTHVKYMRRDGVDGVLIGGE